MERGTIITIAEVTALIVLLLLDPPSTARILVGIPLVLHLGWSAATSLPIGRVPGPPPGVGERRRKHLLRYQVVAFLNQVQQVESLVEERNGSTKPRRSVEQELEVAENRLKEIAGDIVKVAGRSGV